MNICLCFHGLCESYDDLPDFGRELFVSLPDMRELIEELSVRRFTFGGVDDGAANIVSFTFDDGYYNNGLSLLRANRTTSRKLAMSTKLGRSSECLSVNGIAHHASDWFLLFSVPNSST